ncbi:MAG TPA: hypothetical protein VJX91_02560 [Candidatus Eisenbacteria bacterium]|nr:hypothetical protein [Candidatus Eisenbacteria bacterium]
MDIIEKDANPDMEALIPLIDAGMCLALDFGDPGRAVRYMIGSYPEELRFYGRVEEAARAALREATGSDEATARAEAEGRSLTFDALIGDVAAWIRGMSRAFSPSSVSPCSACRDAPSPSSRPTA